MQLQIGPDQGGDTRNLAGCFDFVVDNRRLIAGIALAVTLAGIVYATLSQPVYEANILIQLEDSAKPTNVLGDLSSLFDIKTGAATEMEVLRSRLVVSRAVDNAKPYIEVQPKYFPIIGAWIARHSKRLSSPGLFGVGGYAWGAERAEVSTFAVPEELEGAVFVLTPNGNGGFHLAQDEHAIALDGRIDYTLEAATRYGNIVVHVDRIDANAGTQFLMRCVARQTAVETLQKALAISEKGKQSGIIGVSLEGHDPKVVSNVLNEIGREYIRQSVDRKTEEAEKSLAFLNKQLPAIKEELDRSENSYNELRNRRGVLDVGEENRSILQRSIQAQTKMVELKQKKEELLTRFLPAHPEVQAVAQQMRELGRDLDAINAKIKSLPTIDQEVVRLSRDVKVNADLYTSLLGSAQQLRLIPTNKGGNARLLDAAVPPANPVKPKRPVVIALATLAGLVLGMTVAFFRKSLYRGIDLPREIRQSLGLPVSVTIPHSDSQENLYAQLQGEGKDSRISLLAHDAPFEPAVESLRSFRASLQFSMLHSPNNIVMITSPTPEVGKSFVSANLAAVTAAIGKRVLLIDADLRTGHLHRYFGVGQAHGLSDVLTGKALFGNVIHRDVLENVDFIATGALPPRPAELLAHANFGKLLQLLSPRYDFILVDTAPVLAVSDAMMVGAHAGAIFSIVRGGVSTMNEVEEASNRLNQAGLTITGIVFNDFKPRFARNGYGLKPGKYQYLKYRHE